MLPIVKLFCHNHGLDTAQQISHNLDASELIEAFRVVLLVDQQLGLDLFIDWHVILFYKLYVLPNPVHIGEAHALLRQKLQIDLRLVDVERFAENLLCDLFLLTREQCIDSSEQVLRS